MNISLLFFNQLNIIYKIVIFIYLFYVEYLFDD
jgi:hypothetical protein